MEVSNMEVRLRYRVNDLANVSRVLTYETDNDHLHVGEFIRLQPDIDGEMVVVRIVKITHIKVVADSAVRQWTKLTDTRLLVLVQPARDENTNSILVYSNQQLKNVGFQPI